MNSNENLSAYHSNMPYPEIKVSGKNEEYANLLRNDYVGFVSEMTSTSQYMYHHIVVEDIDPQISNMLRNIGLVEARHLDILGKLIFLLGEKPTYFAGNDFWNGEYIFYGNNILEQLEADLQGEHDVIENYRKNIALIDDPYIKAILERIILDEEVHVKLFEKAIEKVKAKESPVETLTDVIEQNFPQKNSTTF